MKITFMTGLLLVCLTVMCASCSPEIDIQNMDNNIEVGNMNSNIVDGELFTAQSTVGEVINDPAFGNFGHLLFPVDRNVPTSMTLSQVSSSNVYVWYSHISVDKTVEILNFLKKESLSGNQIFFPIYSPEEIAADRSKADTGLFRFSGKNGNPLR